MSIIDRMFPKLPAAEGAPARSPTPRGNGATPAAASPPGADLLGPPELLERRRVLREEFAERQWNLGGVVYEMAIRDHFRLDLVVRLCARLQEVDAELGEVERLVRLEQAGAAGTCPACDALHGRGAVFCWQCGTGLMQQQTVGAEPS